MTGPLDGAAEHHPVLPVEVREALGRFGVVREFDPGEVVFHQGEPGDSMVLVESGRVELVFSEANRGSKVLAAGRLFGELALLTGDQIRSATAVTVAPSRLRIIDHRAFDDLLLWAPLVTVNLLRTTCAYLLQSEQRLVAELDGRNRELERALDFLRRTREDLDSTELLTLTDELTGLYNRRCLNRQSEGVLQRADTNKVRVALLMVDVDHFKQINDQYGHSTGDVVLAHVATAIKEGLRNTDLPCRIGGDEFAVLLQELGEGEALTAARRLPDRIAAIRIPTVDGGLQVTCSVGGTMYRPGEGWQAFFDRADRSLYLAKESGRNRVAVDGELVAESDLSA